MIAGGDLRAALTIAIAHAPYLARLSRRNGDLIADMDHDWPARLLRDGLAAAESIAAAPPPLEEGMYKLRRAKDAVHLATAIADLARAWPLAQVTGALTDFADAALRASLALAASECARRGDLTLADFASDTGPVPGFTLIAMGKMGAGELNYSSDIDFSVFFDSDKLAAAGAREPRVAAVRLVAPLVRALEEVNFDGYVFRTDLRLRPDPGSTPVAVSIASAEHYYQSLGQNWERAAFIKARASAGDLACGREFLASLDPFIWRRHFDFAALEDVHSIKRQILSAHKSADLGEAVFDVKLGRGGIRDIELFAQTQQLILGGRNRALRVRGTLEALDLLAEAGAIERAACEALSEAYVFFREVEHRIQMLEDAQTHKLPADPETRAHVAVLAGFETLTAFDAALISRRAIVAEIDHQLFGRGKSLADPMGSLIFTGVEDHAETLGTIEKLGFRNAAFVSQSIRGWHHGRIRAMRSERARELLTRLTPTLLRALAKAGDADQAFARFAGFFSALSAGVQVLALFEARPALLELLARILTLAPRLADTLARRPFLLDALIEPHFAKPLTQDAPGSVSADLAVRLDDIDGFERALNEARRFHREASFRIGVQALEGAIGAADAGVARTALAEACVAAMARVSLREVERVHGPQPGAFAVLALGKFGGGELAEGSDLDLMVIYDAPAETPNDFYTRLTQRLISALSAPTEEGALYEIDTKLRPSGSKGPVAVRMSSFTRYYEEEAWTWELQALTRARPVAGDAALSEQLARSIQDVLARPRPAAKILADVGEMRALMDRERPGKAPWDLKLAPGGFVDIEFIVQALQLTHASPAVLAMNTGAAIARLAAAGALAESDAALLNAAWRLWSDLQQTLRICVASNFDSAHAPAPLQAKLAAIAGAVDLGELEATMISMQARVREAFMRIVGGNATHSSGNG